MQENRIIKILTLILGAALFIFQRDITTAFVFLCSMIFYVTLSYSEAKKNKELDDLKDEFKKLKDRVDSIAITRALR